MGALAAASARRTAPCNPRADALAPSSPATTTGTTKLKEPGTLQPKDAGCRSAPSADVLSTAHVGVADDEDRDFCATDAAASPAGRVAAAPDRSPSSRVATTTPRDVPAAAPSPPAAAPFLPAPASTVAASNAPHRFLPQCKPRGLRSGADTRSPVSLSCLRHAVGAPFLAAETGAAACASSLPSV